MTEHSQPLDGQCHCGGVHLRLRLSDGLRTARRCNCSYCSMRGAVAVSARLGDLEIVDGQALLSCYTFGTGTAKHYFCSRCGIYTHHQRRSNPEEYGVNVACLAGMSPFDFAEVAVYNGREHPRDAVGDGYDPLAGTLRYTAHRRDPG
ncbi:GFA family protein [Salinisphaera sp. T31B1]|uniref:GFA family protein n=1 Tax=Salinisphaera sp. T31B1 TaxID=727963 RepID=UPI003340B028